MLPEARGFSGMVAKVQKSGFPSCRPYTQREQESSWSQEGSNSQGSQVQMKYYCIHWEGDGSSDRSWLSFPTRMWALKATVHGPDEPLTVDIALPYTTERRGAGKRGRALSFYFFSLRFYFMCVCVLPARLYVHHICVTGVCTGELRRSGPSRTGWW